METNYIKAIQQIVYNAHSIEIALKSMPLELKDKTEKHKFMYQELLKKGRELEEISYNLLKTIVKDIEPKVGGNYCKILLNKYNP